MKIKSLLFASFIIMLFVSCDSSSIDESEPEATSFSVKSKSMKSLPVERDISNPSANGQGTIFINYDGFVPGVQHFSFHANTDINGNVTGSFETKWGINGRLHGTIDCLSILNDGKTAIMSGEITQVQGETYLDVGFVVGMDVLFQVQDNGEGANVLEDTFSDIYADFILPSCSEDFLDVELLTITYGNIQVKK